MNEQVGVWKPAKSSQTALFESTSNIDEKKPIQAADPESLVTTKPLPPVKRQQPGLVSHSIN